MNKAIARLNIDHYRKNWLPNRMRWNGRGLYVCWLTRKLS